MLAPRLVMAAPHGRSGKTTITIGLCAAMVANGLPVQPFKKGPDYIDPSWLTVAAGRPCRNLDLFMMDESTVVAAFARAVADGVVAVVEGAMGLYDGVDLEGSGSTAQLARVLNAPVILVVDTTRMTRSVAALVNGYQHFEAGVHIAGVILNNVASPRHEKMLVGSIERYCGLPVLGCVPKSEDVRIPDRHLGLVPRGEEEANWKAIDAARQLVQTYVDVKRTTAIAYDTPAIAAPRLTAESSGIAVNGPLASIGVLRDRVFSFYYPENLEALTEAGAELVFIDSLADAQLPAIDGLYIGGGFPEVFMVELEANVGLRRAIAKAIEGGLPVYAECAGMMYLARGIVWQGQRREMVGALPYDVVMEGRPQGHGYVAGEVVERNPFLPIGTRLVGHEFHNSKLMGSDTIEYAYHLKRGKGIAQQRDGVVYKNVLASYTHLHALGCPSWAGGFVRAAAGLCPLPLGEG